MRTLVKTRNLSFCLRTSCSRADCEGSVLEPELEEYLCDDPPLLREPEYDPGIEDDGRELLVDKWLSCCWSRA